MVDIQEPREAIGRMMVENISEITENQNYQSSWTSTNRYLGPHQGKAKNFARQYMSACDPTT
jgi:hypothetical protein